MSCPMFLLQPASGPRTTLSELSQTFQRIMALLADAELHDVAEPAYGAYEYAAVPLEWDEQRFALPAAGEWRKLGDLQCYRVHMGQSRIYQGSVHQDSFVRWDLQTVDGQHPLISTTKWISKEKDRRAMLIRPSPRGTVTASLLCLVTPEQLRFTAHTMGGRHLGAMYHRLEEPLKFGDLYHFFKDSAMNAGVLRSTQTFELMGKIPAISRSRLIWPAPGGKKKHANVLRSQKRRLVRKTDPRITKLSHYVSFE